MSRPNTNRIPVLGDSRFIERMMARVIRVPETGCWLWVGGWTRQKYGYCHLRPYNQELAHRAMYRALVADIPDDMCVCHKCDTPPCCNPNHLFIGTQTENMQDRKNKGKYYGTSASSAVLDRAKVISIRALANHKTQRAIAEEHGVSATTVFSVIHRVTWSHIA